ncbi:SWI/SNF-related matrix-associated actin-dependent regulator of chromatin subfamily D member 1 [Thelohanellus kitauei]|uniref:SWI/SNF-related matrix-associated actin-dependent regulator of chromatin subfamily D member 1 n=1 Tax=Thelohanellus kitauei TaxID=669202 RepID=A0A0C2MF44_THEKT|nr:SWI/SNF-related matrix-associated actin-dependent regulator of chromatin subfamily D member 1 [Thelohanellus kitauei]
MPVSKAAISNSQNLGRMEFKIEGKVIEARLLPDSINTDGQKHLSPVDFSRYNRSFSSFFKYMIVEFDPEVYAPDMRSLEWIRSNNTAENEGFVVRRPIVSKNNFTVSFHFSENSIPPQFQLSGPLSQLLGIFFESKPNIYLLFWEYLSRNNLMDICQSDIIHCDEAMHSIFGTDSFNVNDIPSILVSHLSPMPTHSFNIEVENPLGKNLIQVGAFSAPPQNFEIIMEVIMFFTLVSDFFKDVTQPFVVEYGDTTLDMNINEIRALEKKYKGLVESIASLKTRIRDGQNFVRNPSNFMMQWINAQCKDKQTIYPPPLTEMKLSQNEEDKSSEYYTRPFIQELVHRYVYNLVETKNIEPRNQS